MQKLVYPIFSSRHSIGCTFLSWSYHWLSGHEQYWHAKVGTRNLPQNPNTGINAHFFKKNYCAGYQELQNFVANTNNNVENCSLYVGTITSGSVTELNKDYAECLRLASNHAPLIFCVENSQDPWYFLQKRAIDPTGNALLLPNQVELFQNYTTENFLKTYFDNSLKQVEKNIWDLRELIALNYVYLIPDRTYLSYVDRSMDHLYIDSRDLWLNGEDCLNHVFQYLGKQIADSRIDHWRSVYNQWQSTQLKILQFNWYLSTIVDSIVNNYSFDLDFLNLTLLQESVIQGCLIKEHNLNLKCFGLTKFPSNTKDLHVLLEPNIHQQ